LRPVAAVHRDKAFGSWFVDTGMTVIYHARIHIVGSRANIVHVRACESWTWRHGSAERAHNDVFYLRLLCCRRDSREVDCKEKEATTETN